MQLKASLDRKPVEFRPAHKIEQLVHFGLNALYAFVRYRMARAGAYCKFGQTAQFSRQPAYGVRRDTVGISPPLLHFRKKALDASEHAYSR
jgi:hypothetical protein